LSQVHTSHRLFITTWLFLLVMFVPTVARACTPIPQLMIIFVGPAPWGAYALKSLLGLLFVVSIKSILFGYKEKSLKYLVAVLFMFIANIFSTLPGIVGVIITAIPIFWIFTIPLLYFLFKIPSKYISRHFENDKITANRVNVGMILFTIISIVFFFISQSFVEIDNIAYWVLKIIFTTLGVSVGLAITIGFEEAVICWLEKQVNKEDKSFIQSVIWANVWSMFIAAGISAAVILPKRFESADFLISMIHFIRRLVG